MKNGKKLSCKYRTKIINPIFVNSFLLIFILKKYLKSILNSLLFPESNKIETLKFIESKYSGTDEVKRRY